MPPRCNLYEELQSLCILTCSWTQIKMSVVVSSESFHTPFLFNYMELRRTPKASGSFIMHHTEKITSIPCGKHLGKHHCPFWKNRDSHPMCFFIISNFLKISINICFKPSFMCLFETINYFFQSAYKVLSTIANEFGWLFQIHLFFNFHIQDCILQLLNACDVISILKRL